MNPRHVVMNLGVAALLGIGGAAVKVQAGIVISSTRVVYPSKAPEVTLQLSNDDHAPALVQVWLDKGDASASPSAIEVPFIVSPVRLRLDPGQGQALRISYTGEPLPKHRETLFWLNVLEVPPKPVHDSTLQFAFRTRIKFFFRPDGLAGTSNEAPANVHWELVRDKHGKGYALKGINPTPYYVNLGEVSLVIGGRAFDAGQGYIAPDASERFPVKELTGKPAMTAAAVTYTAIDDEGVWMAAGQLAPVDTGSLNNR